MACIMILGLVLQLCPQPVQAQGLTPMQVGVVEFRNDSGVQGNLLARSTTDAVVIELSKSNRFDVITRAQIESQMKELGIRPPLSAVELSRLGEALAAEAMIEGTIKSVEVRGDKGARRASVTVYIRMIDQSSGELINGAVQSGYSHSRVGDNADDDMLIAQAIDNAAYLAVKTMIDYVIPEATVQNTTGTNEVLLNKGARDGIRSGMRMVVTRDREIIGELITTRVDAFVSTAAITKQTRGIRPEDRARAVFDMPTVDRGEKVTLASGAAPTNNNKVRGKTRFKNLLVALGVVAIAAQLWRSNGEDVGDVTAEPAVAADGTASVKVSWDPGTLGKGLNVTNYSVWRDNATAPIATVLPGFGQLFYLDTGATPGVAHQYYVSATYQVAVGQDNSGGTGTGTTDTTGGITYEGRSTVKKPAVGVATPLPRSPLANLTVPVADSSQNLHRITFQWLSQLGADTYVVEVSTNPIFSSPEFVSSTITARPSPAGQTVSYTVNETLYGLFRNIPNTQLVYWRVGARAAGDSPGPVPPTGRPNQRYIYSEINAFRPLAPAVP